MYGIPKRAVDAKRHLLHPASMPRTHATRHIRGRRDPFMASLRAASHQCVSRSSQCDDDLTLVIARPKEPKRFRNIGEPVRSVNHRYQSAGFK